MYIKLLTRGGKDMESCRVPFQVSEGCPQQGAHQVDSEKVRRERTVDAEGSDGGDVGVVADNVGKEGHVWTVRLRSIRGEESDFDDGFSEFWQTRSL